MLPELEKKNQRIGMGVSIGIHGLLLILFFLIMAWREPDPPVPEYGIELNFGLDAVGSGEIQPEQPSATPQLIEEQIISEEIIEEPAEETVEEIPVEEMTVQDEPELIEEQIIEDSEMEDSPDVIEPVETQPEPPIEQEIEPEIVEETTPEPEEEEVVEEQPVARNDNASETVVDGQGTSEEADSDAETTSHGDDADVAGDKGDEQGTLESRALYGNYGGGGGPILDLTGWTWDSAPDPQDDSNETGKIVYIIKIDQEGEIISVKLDETSVPPAVERIYRNEVELLRFSRTSNTSPAAVSTGTITFTIRSK